MWEKLKSEVVGNERHFTAIILVLVALSSFALGQHAGRTTGSGGLAASPVVSMTYTEPAATVQASAAPPVVNVDRTAAIAGVFVASQSGSKYHHETCPGAKQIKTENRITFATEAEAQAAGYTRAANCKYFSTNPTP